MGQTIFRWREVFWIAAAIYIITATFFAIFASGELGEWEKKKEDIECTSTHLSTVAAYESSLSEIPSIPDVIGTEHRRRSDSTKYRQLERR